MDLEHLIAEKRTLEKELRLAVLKLVAAFKEKTDMTPCRINVSMVDVTGMEHRRSHYEVGTVTVDVTLE